MNKRELLQNVIANVRTFADSLQLLADSMKVNESSNEETKQKSTKEKKKSAKKEYSFEDVRGILAEKSKDGFTAEIKAVIEKYGCNKLSDISPENYEAIIEEVKVLGNE